MTADDMFDRTARTTAELAARVAQLEAENRRTTVALAEAQKAIEAKRAFLACIGHELRTPLNAIIGFSEVLSKQSFGPLGHASYREYVGEVLVGGRNLLAIVNDIVGIVQAEASAATSGRAPRSGPGEIYGCVEDTGRTFFERAAEANIVLALELDDEARFDCAVDTAALQTVLERLIDNAIKFTRAGGEIVVDVRAGEDGGLRIVVRDTGIGMTEAEIETALAPFGQVGPRPVRGSRDPGGAGLGLTLASALVSSMGGSFAIASEPGDGTTVTLAFPATARAEPSGNGEGEAADAGVRKAV